jgi:hypothetical protein
VAEAIYAYFHKEDIGLVQISTVTTDGGVQNKVPL